MEPGGAGDGAVAGMDPRAPVGAVPGGEAQPQAAGDLSEHHRGAEFPLADIVRCRDVRVFEEDEELGSPSLERILQRTAGRMLWRDGEERIKATLGAGVVLPQGRRPQAVPTSADADRPAQQLAQLWGEDRIAAVDGVLDITQDMGKADLMC